MSIIRKRYSFACQAREAEQGRSSTAWSPSKLQSKHEPDDVRRACVMPSVANTQANSRIDRFQVILDSDKI